MKPFRLTVPASSANLGPGFDALALALNIVDTVHAVPAENGTVSLANAGELGLDAHHNLICRGYNAWFDGAGNPPPGIEFRLESLIPLSRGLGSSAAAIVAGLTAAAHVSGDKNPTERLVRLAAALEGHADNVTAAALGGVTTAFCDGDQVHALHVVNHLSLGVSLFIPDDPLDTKEARAVLPHGVSRDDAVFNVGRVSYLTTALIWGRWELIGPAMEDRLHQPYRARLLPGLDSVVAAAREAGAYGAALSGGGPSVIALGPAEQAEAVATAMGAAAGAAGWPGSSRIVAIRHLGAMVEEDAAS